MIIDSYTHCGLDKFLPVEAVRSSMMAAGVDRAVLCQHLGQFDNSYIQACVASEPEVFAGVAMIDTTHCGVLENLEHIKQEGIMRGVRMTADSLKNAPSVSRSILSHGMNLVLYCPEGISDIRPQLDKLAEFDGSGRVIITHMGTPVVVNGELTRGNELLECADNPILMVTLSGLGMACEYPHGATWDFVGATVDAFGPRRVMWGSNFPVLGDSKAYGADLALLLDNYWSLPEESIPWISGATSDHLWFDSVTDSL